MTTAKQYAAVVERDDFVLANRGDLGVDRVYGSQSFWRDALSRFVKNKGAVFGLVMIVLIVFMAFAGPALSGYDYRTQDMSQRNLPPHVAGWEAIPIFSGVSVQYANGQAMRTDVYEQKGIRDVTHIFGTDALGRDQFARTWTGTRVSLYVALVAILIDTLIGMSFGLVSGYFGGKVDFFLQRIVEILSTIPTTVIVTLLIVVMKPGLASITLALMITEWIGMSRVTRAQTLRLKEQEFVLASRTLGESTPSIIFAEILPNIFGQIIVMCMMTIPNAIFTEAFLAFIGLGIPAPLASLGSLISDGFKSMTLYPFLVAWPVAVLALLMLSFNLMADGLRDALDPRMKER
ncbi:MAG: ABC transporter permease [Ruminococcaceae bacterium]|nr:ABC transporter permease [Oscillospiraceae bacterium]